MKILFGVNKGKDVQVGQWCNDWFTDNMGNIYSPTEIQLTPEEAEKVKNHDNNGILFSLFKLNDNGTFTKIPLWKRGR